MAKRVADWEPIAGFSLFLALASTSAWGLITLVSMTQLTSTEVVGYETLRSVSFLACLFALGFGCLRLAPLFRVDTSVPSTVLWACGYAAAFALVAIAPQNSGARSLLLVVSSLCLGAAHALSFVVWQRVFFSRGDAAARRAILIGSALGALEYLLVSLVGDVRAYAAVMAALIAANALFLNRCARGLFPGRIPGERVVLEVGGDAMRSLMGTSWRYAVCIASVGYVNGVSHMLVRGGSGDALTLNVILAVGMFVACAIMLFLWEGLRLSFTFTTAYTVIFFAMITAFLAVPFFDDAYRLAFAGLANLAFTVVSMFMMITCLRIARLRSFDPVGVFGVFAGIVYGGVLAGRLVGVVFGGTSDVSQLFALALLSVYVLSFSGALVNLARGRVGAAAQTEGFDPIRGAEGPKFESDAPAGSLKDERAQGGTAAATPAAQSGKRTAAMRSVMTHATATHAETPATQTKPADPPHMVHRVVVLQDAVPACCRALRREYGLSNREADVLELIARGRDVARMAEALFVSENTVRSHCKSLYRKLGVHSRQEVFDLLESYRDEGSKEDGGAEG